MTAKERNKEIREMQPPVKRGRKSKTPDGLRLYKDKATRRRINILQFSKRRVEEGYEKADILNMLVDEYNITQRTAERYYLRAKELLTYSMAWDADTIRNKNIQRLSEIAEEAHEDCDYQDAIKAIDVLNKTANVYIDKKEINIDGNEITFTFGEAK